MSSSLLKFIGDRGDNQRGQLHWGRADLDGAPFRARNGVVPLLRNDEMDERLVRIADPRNGLFYTGDPEENAKYLKVMDGIANNWYQQVYIKRWRKKGNDHPHVYIEWLEYYMEDGKPIGSAGT